MKVFEVTRESTALAKYAAEKYVKLVKMLAFFIAFLVKASPAMIKTKISCFAFLLTARTPEGRLSPRRSTFCLLLVALLSSAFSGTFAQSPPLDLWSSGTQLTIRDRSTLNYSISARTGYFEVYFDSNNNATWADGGPPYAIHTGGRIRIHGYLASPLVAGPYPAIVIGHGHHGHGSAEEAIALAALGYVALSIDGPGQGLSTGPPDTEQGWISVEETMNVPAPYVSYQYHYAYAGMRALTLFEKLSGVFLNPFRIDRTRLGVIGASMGGQFTYYINGVDDRVKGAVGIAVAGDWRHVSFYPGSWLYHGLYYYTRDGLQSGHDYLNTVSNFCTDPTLTTFLNYFDPIAYARTQHGPLLTIIGSHDQFFTVPAINSTYQRIASAGTSQRFRKRIMIKPNGKHGVLTDENLYADAIELIQDIAAWFNYCFNDGPVPPGTPTVWMEARPTTMVFHVTAPAGGRAIRQVKLYYASQMDSRPSTVRDFGYISLLWTGFEYVGTIPIGRFPPAGPPVTPNNIIYLASVKDEANYTVTSKLYYRSGVMAFGQGFLPVIEHYDGDTLPVPPPPYCP
jgi:cephalosporin-C deacetylase-like acetyl esterase